jgi:hypothetical protein
MFMFSSFPVDFTVHSPFHGGLPLFLLASAFIGWLAATDAYPVLDLLAAGLAWATSAGLAHRNLLDSR